MPFDEDISNRFAKGYVKGAYWFKFDIQNLSEKTKYILHFNEVLFEQFDFYTFENASWKKHESGFAVPVNQRSIETIYPSFILNIKTNESKVFYVHAKSKFSYLGAFGIYEYETFFTQDVLSSKLYLIYFGVLCMLTVLNLFLYIRFKESIYIYYVGYIVFFTLFVLLFSGYIFYFGLQQWYYELHFAAPFFLMFLLLFSNKLLNIYQILPQAFKVLKCFIGVLLLLALFIIIDVDPWYEVLNLFATSVFILLFYAAIMTMKKGNKKSMYYLMALSIYLFTILFMSSMANGWLEYTNFNRYAYLFGSCFEIIFFALILVNRFYSQQHERLVVQKKLLEIQEQNETYLKQEVEYRTQEIQKMNRKLYDIVQDKELLLKELYHRVKNNFQMVISLLWMELYKMEQSATKERFSNIINRIKAMSMMHDYLYNSKTLSNIKSDEYILSIIEEVKQIYNTSNVSINATLFNSDITINNAMNLGMIINEVLNNAIKHHGKEEKCVIDLYFKKYDNAYVLSIQDNGIGFDSSKITSGLGMGIIQQFANKMHQGAYIFLNNHGTRFELSFKTQSK